MRCSDQCKGGTQGGREKYNQKEKIKGKTARRKIAGNQFKRRRESL